MNSITRNLALFWSFAFFFHFLLHSPALALNGDATLLISLKRSILGDPLNVLANWNFNDDTPCSWRGVTCTDLQTDGGGWTDSLRVTALSLPGSQLLGSIPDELGMIEHLRLLDLSGNFFNGSLPVSIFNASELQILSLSNNVISGELPVAIGGLRSLQVLNLSDNALAGKVPGNLTALRNLTVVSLRSNYFTGEIPGNFSSTEVLDLSSNLLNGSLPADFGGEKLRYLNFSYNKISSSIPVEFAEKIPANATMDLSFNNLTGVIPQSTALLNQKTEAFAGNEDLCGKPLKHLCSIPSSLTTPPNVSDSSSSSPAIAAIPKTIGAIPATQSLGGPNGTQTPPPRNAMKPITIAAIAVGDLAGVAILAVVILYVYHHQKQKKPNSKTPKSTAKKPPIGSQQTLQTNQKKPSSVLFCLPTKGEETSEATSSSDGEEQRDKPSTTHDGENRESQKNGVLVTVDVETELELETLLKASAYILGASGGSIVYKAVLEDGTAFAVRRIGDCGIESFKDFETQVRAIAKLRHQNLVKIRGFFWGEDEKLIIYDYVSNGCLASSIHRKPSSSSSSQSHLSLEIRLKIARGIARGLTFIHDKKHVHGNLKPSNILLNDDMEPLITDLGLDKLLISGSKIALTSASTRNFGSHRSTPNREHQESNVGSAISGGSPGVSLVSAYQAPESLRNLKPSPKWDVYSFGVILLEILSGRIVTEREANQWNGGDDEVRMKKMINPHFIHFTSSQSRENRRSRRRRRSTAMSVAPKLLYPAAGVLYKRPSTRRRFVYQCLNRSTGSRRSRGRGFQLPRVASVPYQPINVDYLEEEFNGLGHGVRFEGIGDECAAKLRLENGGSAIVMFPSGLITSYKSPMWHGGSLELLHSSVCEDENGDVVVRGGVSLALDCGSIRLDDVCWTLHDVKGNPRESIQVELISGAAEGKVELKYIVTLGEDMLRSELIVSNNEQTAIQLKGSVLSHLTVSTPEATYAIGLEGSDFYSRAPCSSSYSIVPPDYGQGSGSGLGRTLNGILSGWGKSKEKESEEVVEGEEGEESDNYKQLTEEMSRIYTSAPRNFTIIDRGRRNSVVVGRDGFDELYMFSPGSNHVYYGEYSFICVGHSAMLKPILLQPHQVWRGSQSLFNPNL